MSTLMSTLEKKRIYASIIAVALLAIGLSIVMHLLLFYTPVGNAINLYMQKLARGEIDSNNFRILGMTAYIIISGITGILGYLLASKYNKDKVRWTILCVLFNIWALVVLIAREKCVQR